MRPASGASDQSSVPAAPNAPERDVHGRWIRGNAAAVATGLFSASAAAALEDHVQAFVAGSVADDGGADEVTTRRRSLLEYRARIHRRIVQLDGALEVRGLLDRRGKLRVAWLQQLAALISGARGLDVVLGLERRRKRVPTLHEVIDECSGAFGPESQFNKPIAADASTADTRGDAK